MSSFGGGSQFGVAQFGGEPSAYPIDHGINEILDALAPLGRDQGGPVATIDIMSVPLSVQTDWSMLLSGGLPALLVGYSGGTFSQTVDTAGYAFEQAGNFHVAVLTDTLRSRSERLAGISAYGQGLWSLLRWVALYAGRALNEVHFVRGVRPVREEILSYGPEYFAGAVHFEATWCMDLYPDADQIIGRLERIGIVHTPKDLQNLFLGDNLTPNTDDVTSLPGPGVAELVD